MFNQRYQGFGATKSIQKTTGSQIMGNTGSPMLQQMSAEPSEKSLPKIPAKKAPSPLGQSFKFGNQNIETSDVKKSVSPNVNQDSKIDLKFKKLRDERRKSKNFSELSDRNFNLDSNSQYQEGMNNPSIISLSNQRPLYNKNVNANQNNNTVLGREQATNYDAESNSKIMDPSRYQLDSLSRTSNNPSDIPDLNELIGLPATKKGKQFKSNMRSYTNYTHSQNKVHQDPLASISSVPQDQKVMKARHDVPKKRMMRDGNLSQDELIGQKIHGFRRNQMQHQDTFNHTDNTNKNLNMPNHPYNMTQNSAMYGDFGEFQSVNNSVALDGQGLMHATSLEKHIMNKIKKKQKFQESYFQYEKNLSFQNPLNNYQFCLIIVSVLWLNVYPIIYAVRAFDGTLCQRVPDSMNLDPSQGEFVAQFLIFIILVDLQAIFVRVYLFYLMNKKMEPAQSNTTQPNLKTSLASNQKDQEEQFPMQEREKSLQDIINPKKEPIKIDLHWRILYFLPILILGIFYQYGLFYQMMTDIMILVLLSDKPIYTVYFLMLFYVIIQKIWYIIQFISLVKILVQSLKTRQVIDSIKIDKCLVQMNYINLSNILYERITTNKSGEFDGGIEKKYMIKSLFIQALNMVIQCIIKTVLTQDETFQKECTDLVGFLWLSIVFSVLCFIRYVIYFFKRVDVSQEKDENVMLAVDYIQEYVNDNQLCIIVNNRNCDFILKHLANFIKLSKMSNYRNQGDESAANAKKLQCISIKFNCTLYHKIYKEDILKILLHSSKTINNHTKIQELKLFETVLSNQDFFLLGQIIHFIPQIRSIIIEQCLIMHDHLFNRRNFLFINNKKQPQYVNFNDITFEQEIVQYLRNGLQERYKSPTSKVEHLDLVLTLANPVDSNSFGIHICGYYKKVQINKKRLYDELDKLLSEFNNFSVQFRIALSQRRQLRIKEKVKKIAQPHSINSHRDSFGDTMEDPQNASRVLDRERAVENVEIYDSMDMQYMIKLSRENKNMMFFTQRKLQNLISRLPNMFSKQIDLMNIPNLFEVVKDFDVGDYTKVMQEKYQTEEQQVDQKKAQQESSDEDSPNVLNIEQEEFVNMITEEIKNSKFIQTLKFRIVGKQSKNKDTLQYFGFNKRQYQNLFKILNQTSNICILQNLKISSQRHKDEERPMLKDLKAQMLLQDAILSMSQLCSVSITSINLDLTYCLRELVSKNQSLHSIELINCTNYLSLNEQFFEQLDDSIVGLKKFNLSNNNATIKDVPSLCHFMLLIAKNHCVDFSKNPLFFNKIPVQKEKVRKVLQEQMAIAEFDYEQLEILPTEEINLSDTFLGSDSSNKNLFFSIFKKIFCTKKNQLNHIDLSQNLLVTLDPLMSDSNDYETCFQTLIMNNPTPKLNVNLSNNQLGGIELLRLVHYGNLKMSQDDKANSPGPYKSRQEQDSESRCRLYIDLSNNCIDLTEFNKYSLAMISKCFNYRNFVMSMIEPIDDRVLQKNFAVQQSSVESLSPEAEGASSPTRAKPMKQGSFTKVNDNQDDLVLMLAQKKLAAIILRQNNFQTMSQYFGEQNVATPPEQSKVQRAHNKEQERFLLQTWRIISLKKLDFSVLNGVDLGKQNCKQETTDSKPMSPSRKNSKIKTFSNHGCIAECQGIINYLGQYVCKIVKDDEDELDPILNYPEAKYFLKILQQLQSMIKEYQIHIMQFAFKFKFQMNALQNGLQIVKLQKSQLNHEQLLKVIKELKSHPVKHIDISYNSITPLICRELALLCQVPHNSKQTQQLREIILDSTDITMSGMFYIFTTFCNEKTKINLDATLLDNQNPTGDIEVGSSSKMNQKFNPRFIKRQASIDPDHYEEDEMGSKGESINVDNDLIPAQYSTQTDRFKYKSKNLITPKSQTFVKARNGAIQQLGSRNYSLASKYEHLSDENATFGQSMIMCLDKLSLRSNKIDNSMMKRMKMKFLQGAAIRSIDLSDNPIGDKGSKYVKEYFAENWFIEELILSQVGLTDQGIIKIIDIFSTSPNMKVLDISNNEKMQKIVQIAEKRTRILGQQHVSERHEWGGIGRADSTAGVMGLMSTVSQSEFLAERRNGNPGQEIKYL